MIERSFSAIVIFLMLSTISCTTKTTNTRRIPALESAKPQTACKTDFNKASDRFIKIVEANQSKFNEFPLSKLQSLAKQSKVVCVSEKVYSHGFEVEGDTIRLEESMVSLASLFETNQAAESAQKNDNDLRTVTFDRVLVAIAASVYAHQLGIRDLTFDIFFRTLKIMEQ